MQIIKAYRRIRLDYIFSHVNSQSSSQGGNIDIVAIKYTHSVYKSNSSGSSRQHTYTGVVVLRTPIGDIDVNANADNCYSLLVKAKKNGQNVTTNAKFNGESFYDAPMNGENSYLWVTWYKR